jgi:D-alanyl-D-alanine carboxypeptidase
MAQATGQASFPLEYVEKDTFKFEDGGIEIVFQPDKGEFTLKQQGTTYKFIKEK